LQPASILKWIFLVHKTVRCLEKDARNDCRNGMLKQGTFSQLDSALLWAGGAFNFALGESERMRRRRRVKAQIAAPTRTNWLQHTSDKVRDEPIGEPLVAQSGDPGMSALAPLLGGSRRTAIT
jgi:hypothetical protein